MRVSQAEQRVRELSRVAAGEFDGACPLVSITCPATKQINGMRSKTRAERDAAVVDHDSQAAAARAAQSDLTELRLEADALTRKLATIDSLRARAKELRARAAGAPFEEPNLSECLTRANDAAVALQAARQAYKDMKAWEAELVTIEDQRKAAADEIAVHRYAQMAFGRNGAQRLVAESALAEIERDANSLLAETGIDLEIEVVWSREGGGLASHCDGCGAPYPASQKVKACARCGAQRGQKTVDKLDIELSDRSGAAEDLAGIAFQLAASAWLRAERGSAWCAAAIDEPFGALDETNRRALAIYFATMLRGKFGFAQAFVVAHDRGIMDALPLKVQILAGDAGSRFA
jgi:DNA repair exonuclease SbcCD ATPase subunit